VTARAERRTSGRQPRESRHRGRETAIQMLYQWEVGKASMDDVQTTFWVGPASDDVVSEEHRAFAMSLAEGVSARVSEIDPIIGEAAEHWRIERMNVMDRLILRLAVYEFLHQSDTPAKVVINEALELARTFSNDDSVRFINGILDAIRRKLQRE
jgi:transcription antitermination protein NusB